MTLIPSQVMLFCQLLILIADVASQNSAPNVEPTAPNVPNEIAMDCSDVISTAVQKLKAIARQNGFTIHDVPADGSCMFSAIAYQLNSADICNIGSDDLRQNVADHLEANKASYCDFLCQPVAQNDGYNADTEPPTQENMYIDSIADPELQAQLRWQKYVRCLRKGDNIAMQAIADMLNVTIHVLSSDYPVYSVIPQSNCADFELFVGLIMQYHYVSLKIADQPEPIATQPVQSDNANSVEPILPDPIITDHANHAEQSEPVLPDSIIPDHSNEAERLNSLNRPQIMSYMMPLLKQEMSIEGKSAVPHKLA